MAIKGSLEEATVPDVLQLLSLGKKTGCLSVTDWTSLGYIYVDAGRITYATIVNRRDRLGDILVRSGRITQDQLDVAISAQNRDRSKRIGELLVEQGAIGRAELERHMRAQIEEAVYFLFTWRIGSFTFESDMQPERQDFLVSIEPESLMLEGARRTDEWTLIEKKVPSFGIVFDLHRERLTASKHALDDDQRRIVPLVDGRRDVAEIVDLSGLPEFAVGKALYGLLNAGLAHPVARKDTERRLSAAGVRVDPDPDATPSDTAAPAHLDFTGLLRYLAREGVFADANRRRAAAFHIADCPTCSKRLKELHRRRTTEQTTARAAPATAAAPAQPSERSGERRTGVDRRESDPHVSVSGRRRQGGRSTAGGLTLERRTGLDRRDSDRRARTGGAGPATAAAAAAAPAVPLSDPRMAYDRRSWDERRHDDRRRGERRQAVSVDRADKYAVDRRSGKDRRRSERRSTQRRAADRAVPAPPQRRTLAAQGVRGGAGAGSTKPGTAPQQKGGAAPTRATAPKRAAPSAKKPPTPPTPPVVMKEQSSTLETRPAKPASAEIVPESKPRIFLSAEERKSLAGLPVVEMPGLEPTAPSAPPPARKPQPAIPARGEPTAATEVPAPPSIPQPSLVPVQPERQPVAAPPRGTEARAPGTPRHRTVLWGGVAAVALIVGWFGRPIVQSLVGGGEDEGAPAEVAALQIPPAVPAATPVPDSAASDSAPAGVLTTPAPARTEPPAETAPVRREEAARPPVREPAAPRPAEQPVETVAQQPEPRAAQPPPEAAQAPAVRQEPAPAAAPPEPVTADSGRETRASLTVGPPPRARDPDTELGEDQWVVTDAADAAAILGMPAAVVDGLWIETIAKPASGARPRIRVAQLTQSGDRVILVIARAGAPARQPNPRVTALRIIPASAAYPTTTGTASFGNLLVTAKTDLPADSLRVQLSRLTEVTNTGERQ